MFTEFTDTFIKYSAAILPWFAVGIAAAYVVDRKLDHAALVRHHFARLSLKRLLTVQLLGMISPLSIMSFLPIAHELTELGFNPGVLLSFFMAERAYDLQSFFIIWGLFGLKYATLNAIAILLSLFAAAVYLRTRYVNFKATGSQMHNGFWRRQGKLLLLVVAGVILGALLRAYIPEREFERLAGGGISGLVTATVLGFLLYFGPIVGNYPVARAFSDLGMSQAGVFAFLTVSPVLNIVVIMMFGAAVGYKNALKAFFVYGLTAAVMTVLLSALL